MRKNSVKSGHLEQLGADHTAMGVASSIERWVAERVDRGEVSASWAANARWAAGHAVKVLGAGELDGVEWSSLRQLGAGLKPSSRALVVHLVRSWVMWSIDRGDPVPVGALRELPRVRVPAPAPRALSHLQAARLRAACTTTRERVVVELGMVTGLRRAEIAGLQVADVDVGALTLVVRSGKGGKRRVVPMSVELAEAVEAWLRVAGHRSGPMIGVGTSMVWAIVDAVVRRAGLKVEAYDGVSVHALRHTAGTRAHHLTGDLLLVRDFLGHSSVATTQRYCGVSSIERLRAALG